MSLKVSRVTVGRVILCVLGNIILGLGVALCKTSNFGTDPFNSLCLSVSGAISSHEMAFPIFTWCFNLTLFLVVIIWGRRYIHIGTFVNWFLPSYVAKTVLAVTKPFLGDVQSLWIRALLLAAGILAISFGLALYQHVDLGIAPYDAIPLMVIDRFPKAKFFIIRIALDASAVIGSLIAGGIAMKTLGIGTAIIAFGLGPCINMYTYLIWGRKEKSSS